MPATRFPQGAHGPAPPRLRHRTGTRALYINTVYLPVHDALAPRWKWRKSRTGGSPRRGRRHTGCPPHAGCRPSCTQCKSDLHWVQMEIHWVQENAGRPAASHIAEGHPPSPCRTRGLKLPGHGFTLHAAPPRPLQLAHNKDMPLLSHGLPSPGLRLLQIKLLRISNAPAFGRKLCTRFEFLSLTLQSNWIIGVRNYVKEIINI